MKDIAPVLKKDIIVLIGLHQVELSYITGFLLTYFDDYQHISHVSLDHKKKRVQDIIDEPSASDQKMIIECPKQDSFSENVFKVFFKKPTDVLPEGDEKKYDCIISFTEKSSYEDIAMRIVVSWGSWDIGKPYNKLFDF